MNFKEEMDLVMDNSGDLLCEEIMRQNENYIKKNYTPEHVVLWRPYWDTILKSLDRPEASDELELNHNTIFGLKVVLTETPDTVKVY